MTQEQQPDAPANEPGEGVNTGESGSDSSNFQPTIDTNQAGATDAYGEGSIQILEGLEAAFVGGQFFGIRAVCAKQQADHRPHAYRGDPDHDRNGHEKQDGEIIF